MFSENSQIQGTTILIISFFHKSPRERRQSFPHNCFDHSLLARLAVILQIAIVYDLKVIMPALLPSNQLVNSQLNEETTIQTQPG